MARVVTDPPPFNLTQSVASADYLRKIIAGGGASVGRSPQMPPWGTALDNDEITAVIQFIDTLRTEPLGLGAL